MTLFGGMSKGERTRIQVRPRAAMNDLAVQTAVRALLLNEAYTGRRVWAKQQKVQRLIDPDDVAAGNQVRMRWRNEKRLDPQRDANPPSAGLR